MRAAAIIARLRAMSPSRRRQWLALKRDRLVTVLVHARRLRKLGTGSIVQTPLFWTPEYIEIGDRVLIWSGSRIEGVDRYGGKNYRPLIRVGNDVSVQQNCHLVIASTLDIGADTTISSNVFITDTDHGHEAFGINVMQQPLSLRPTTIGKSCFLGVGARILAGTQLGDHCIVAANAVVRGRFPDGCVIAGMPARVIRRFDPRSGEWRRVDGRVDFS